MLIAHSRAITQLSNTASSIHRNVFLLHMQWYSVCYSFCSRSTSSSAVSSICTNLCVQCANLTLTCVTFVHSSGSGTSSSSSSSSGCEYMQQ
jgi:hypothetical protein